MTRVQANSRLYRSGKNFQMDPQFTVAYSTVAEDKTFGQSLRTFCPFSCQLCLTCLLSNVGVSQNRAKKTACYKRAKCSRAKKRAYLPTSIGL